MRMTAIVILAIGLLGASEPQALAQSFMGLGDLPGGSFESFAENLSADGRFVTGFSATANGSEAFIWSQQTGILGLGVPAGSDSSTAFGVSNDGGTVVGFHEPLNTARAGRALLWTSSSGATDFDPFPAGATDRVARDISADGGTIVGHYRSGTETPTIAFHWDGTTLTDVLTSGVASGVSADGSVVVGTQLFNPDGPPPLLHQAFRWTSSVGVLRLGYLDGGSEFSFAEGVSADGQVIVGVSESGRTSLGEAFRWTESDGMIGLGDLLGGDFQSIAHDTTADGRIVVGVSSVQPGPSGVSFAPFIWDETNGMRNLVDVLVDEYGLADQLAGWDLGEARAISDDGTVIVGFGINPDGNFEAWRAVLVPEPSTVLLSTVTFLGLLLRRIRCEA